MGYHDLSAAAGGRLVSTQDRAVRGGDVAHEEAAEGEAAAGASGGLSEATRLRVMQRRWIQRKASGAGGGAASIPGGPGAPLGGGVQARMEKTLGADLSGVRVHTGGDSADAADSLGARAFTVGSDVHFGRGEFAPGSREGDRLLAHELTHEVGGDEGARGRVHEERLLQLGHAADVDGAQRRVGDGGGRTGDAQGRLLFRQRGGREDAGAGKAGGGGREVQVVPEVGRDERAHRAEGGDGRRVLVAERAGRDQGDAAVGAADDRRARAEREPAHLERMIDDAEIAIEELQAHGEMVKSLY